MFNSIIVRAKSVRCGELIKVAGKKCEIIATMSFYGTDEIELVYLTTKMGTVTNTLRVNKNAPIKVYHKK